MHCTHTHTHTKEQHHKTQMGTVQLACNNSPASTTPKHTQSLTDARAQTHPCSCKCVVDVPFARRSNICSLLLLLLFHGHILCSAGFRVSLLLLCWLPLILLNVHTNSHNSHSTQHSQSPPQPLLLLLLLSFGLVLLGCLLLPSLLNFPLGLLLFRHPRFFWNKCTCQNRKGLAADLAIMSIAFLHLPPLTFRCRPKKEKVDTHKTSYK